MEFILLDKIFSESSPRTTVDSTDIYLKEIGKVKLLTAEQEGYYARQYKLGDLKARDILIKSNLRLVVTNAKRYSNRGFLLLDLVEEGNLGLMKAVELYDPDKGFRFSTYATWWIRQNIERAMINQGRTIRLPVHINREVILLKRNTKQDCAHDEGAKHLVMVLGKSINQIHALKQLSEHTTSLDCYVGGDDSKTKTIKECLVDNNAEDPFDISMQNDMRIKVEECIDYLQVHEQKILRKRYGLEGNPLTLEEVAKDLGLTRERIRQIQDRAQIKLKRIMRRKGIRKSILYT